MEPEVQTPITVVEANPTLPPTLQNIAYINRGDTQLKNAVINLDLLTPLGDRIRPLERFFNDNMNKAFGLSHAHKYTMCYLKGEVKHLEYIPRVNIPDFMISGEVTFLNSLFESNLEYNSIGFSTVGDYTYFYLSPDSLFSNPKNILSVKIHRRTKTREESYKLWYEGLFNVVLKGIECLGLRFGANELEIPLTSGGEELSKFGISNVVQNVLASVDLSIMVAKRDDYTDATSFMNDVIQSPAFSLDWVSLNSDGTSKIPESETPDWLRRAQAYVLAQPYQSMREKSEWGLNRTFVNYLKTGTSFESKVNETLQIHFKNSMVDNRIIDAAYDMDSRDSVDLNKKLRMIEAYNAPDYKKLVLSSNPMSLRGKVNHYIVSNRLAA